MKKLLFISLACLAVSAAMAGIITQPRPASKIQIAQKAISQLYVDSVDDEKLVEWAIKGMLDQLDPHSSYSNAKETAELNEPLQGNFSGIGISYNIVKDTLYVIEVISGGPSEKVGLRPGDRIVAVNDTSIAGVNVSKTDIMKKLRGPKGTEVDLTVMRGTDKIPFRIIRDMIPIYSIDAAYMADPTTGYISITRFAADTDEEFRQALQRLKKQGMKNLILDLTDNGGGYLGSAVEVLSELLPAESMAVYTEGLNSPRTDYRTQPLRAEPMFADGRLVVMVNQYSASASEITSGAVQDYDRGLIVGRRTFGKGLVQRPIPLPDGSMIRLTTSHYYTPAGRDIQKPYKKGDEESYNKDILTRLQGGELMHADSVHLDSTKLFHTLRLQRPIYGGGGIMPDKFVPLDTTQNSKTLRNLNAKNVLNQWVLLYVDAHRSELKKKYKTDDAFVKNFQVTPSMLSDLRQMAETEKVEIDAEGWQASEPMIMLLMKALIGRDLYEQQTFSKVYNERNDIYQEALRLIHSKEYDSLLQ